MNNEIWITIALTAIASSITLFIGLWQIKVMLAIAKPTETPQKLTSAVDNGNPHFVKKHRGDILGFFLCLICLYLLLEFSLPRTPLAIFSIIFTSISIGSQVLFFMLRSYINLVMNFVMKRQYNLLREHQKLWKRITNSQLKMLKVSKDTQEINEFLNEQVKSLYEQLLKKSANIKVANDPTMSKRPANKRDNKTQNPN